MGGGGVKPCEGAKGSRRKGDARPKGREERPFSVWKKQKYYQCLPLSRSFKTGEDCLLVQTEKTLGSDSEYEYMWKIIFEYFQCLPSSRSCWTGKGRLLAPCWDL